MNTHDPDAAILTEIARNDHGITARVFTRTETAQHLTRNPAIVQHLSPLAPGMYSLHRESDSLLAFRGTDDLALYMVNGGTRAQRENVLRRVIKTVALLDGGKTFQLISPHTNQN